MMALLIGVLIAGVTASLHCAAMCGPFAALSQHQFGFALGRLGSYIALGAVAGTVGAAVNVAGNLATIGPVAMALAGAAMVAWGAASMARALGWRRKSEGTGATQPMLFAIRRRRGAWRGALIGAFTVVLPCGWLWAFVVIAAGTGAPHTGAAVMAALWLGSTPALLGAGATLRVLGRRLGPRLPILVASLQLAIGILALAMRAPMLDAPPQAATAEIPTEASCH